MKSLLFLSWFWICTNSFQSMRFQALCSQLSTKLMRSHSPCPNPVTLNPIPSGQWDSRWTPWKSIDKKWQLKKRSLQNLYLPCSMRGTKYSRIHEEICRSRLECFPRCYQGNWSLRKSQSLKKIQKLIFAIWQIFLYLV